MIDEVGAERTDAKVGQVAVRATDFGDELERLVAKSLGERNAEETALRSGRVGWHDEEPLPDGVRWLEN